MRLTCEATWCLSGNRNGISPHVRDTPRRLWKPSNLQVCLPHTDTKMSKFSELCKTFLSATHHNHQCQPRRIHPLSLPKVGGLVNPLRGSAARAFLREHLLLRCTPPPHKKKKKTISRFLHESSNRNCSRKKNCGKQGLLYKHTALQWPKLL